MDVDQLMAFDRIVREGSFSRAARGLQIAQPTISARIQALEQAVGGPLFARSSRRISLTALGVSFLPYARRALDVLSEGVEAARQAEGGQRGRMTIGTLGSLTGDFRCPGISTAHLRRRRRVRLPLPAARRFRDPPGLGGGAIGLAHHRAAPGGLPSWAGQYPAHGAGA